jgi:alcohol dehydrogenase, propanol-preferring
MRAARVKSDGTLEMQDLEKPLAAPGQVLVAVKAAGVCGTDLHILDGMIRPDVYPMTLGHESAGVVEQVGAGVQLAVGTRVVVYNKLFCGTCNQCLGGYQNLCDREAGQFGFNRDGGDAGYQVIPESNAVPIPDGVDFATAAVLACAGMTAVHVVRVSRLASGEVVAVNGIGGVGILVVQAARRAGALVIAVADSDEKLELAKLHGAQDGFVVTSDEGFENLPAELRARTGGRSADVVFELVGTSASMLAGVRALSKHGRFVSTGYTDEPISMHPIELILSETSILSTVAATRLDLEEAVRMAADGSLVVPIARRYPLDEIGTALTALRARHVLGRQVVEMT